MNVSEPLFQKSLFGQFDALLSCWSLWEDSIDFYVSELIPSLQEDPSTGIQKETAAILAIKKLSSEEEWLNLPQLIKDYMQHVTERGEAGKRVASEIRELLDEYS